VISFACPHCGRQLQLRDDFAGKRGKCPHCKNLLTVPLATGGLALAPEAAGAAATLPPTGEAILDGRTLPPNPKRLAPVAVSETLRTDGSNGVQPEVYDFLAPAQQPDEIGRLGMYRVLRVLGAGGMGVVFHAEDIALQRPVALKAMLPALAATPANRERFLREARAAAAIEHDHIVTIHQVGEENGVPFMAMQLLRGESLEAHLQREGVLPPAEVLRIGRETAEGLAAAAERGLVHRDIKPANIWLEGERRRVKILDFGLARGTSDNAHLTQQGVIIGTPAYMAPEQCGGKGLDARCDLFSLGCVLYRVSTGALPFIGEDTVSTLLAVATQQPRDPRALNPAMPASLSRIILRLLAKDPAKRYASAREVSEALTAVECDPVPGAAPIATPAVTVVAEPASRRRAVLAEDERTIEQAATAPRPSSRPAPRRRPRRARRTAWPWILGGVAALLVVVLGGVFVALAIKPGSVPTSPASNPVVQGPVATSAPVVVPPPPRTNPPTTRPVENPPDRNGSRAAAEWVLKHHGTIGVKIDSSGQIYLTNAIPKEPFHLLDILLSKHKEITDDELGSIRDALDSLEMRWIYLDGTSITDAGLAHLSKLKKLDQLFAQKTRVTQAGAHQLLKWVPRCSVSYDTPRR
jgi:serine/threonine protein kinase